MINEYVLTAIIIVIVLVSTYLIASAFKVKTLLIKEMTLEIEKLFDEKDDLIKEINTLKSKSKPGNELRMFINDISRDEGIVSISRIDPDTIFFHMRDK